MTQHLIAATAMSGAGYMTITNTGSAPDCLLEVRADFPYVTLHGRQADAQGVIGVIPATLVLDRAGEIAVEFWVEPRNRGVTGHEGHEQGGLAPGPDPLTIAATQAALRDVLGADAVFGPVALQRSAKRRSPRSKPISIYRKGPHMTPSPERGCWPTIDGSRQPSTSLWCSQATFRFAGLSKCHAAPPQGGLQPCCDKEGCIVMNRETSTMLEVFAAAVRVLENRTNLT